MLNTGGVAPAIELPDSDMNLRSLAEFAGSWVVVYFYPKDDTPGCTIQANEFTDLSEAYADAGITVLGISADDCFSHQAFRQKFGLKTILLADVEMAACNDYGVYQEQLGSAPLFSPFTNSGDARLTEDRRPVMVILEFQQVARWVAQEERIVL